MDECMDGWMDGQTGGPAEHCFLDQCSSLAILSFQLF